mmetsp:Transcript_23590/g.31642  ORF Transcript_23590/g.31642 Transcript_23590/m.31642 type:complete len:133 (-) Transcript_23590:497-895(-)
MRVINPVEHAFTARTLGKPENDFTLMRGASEEFFLVWVPSHNGDLLFVPLEAVELTVALAYIEDFNFVVATAGQEPVAIDGVPAHLIDGRVVRMDFVHVATARSRVPNLNVLVLAAREDERLGRVPVTRLDI